MKTVLVAATVFGGLLLGQGVASAAPTQEDKAGWACAKWGNQICGPDNSSGAAAGCYVQGKLVIPWTRYDNPELDPLYRQLHNPCIGAISPEKMPIKKTSEKKKAKKTKAPKNETPKKAPKAEEPSVVTEADCVMDPGTFQWETSSGAPCPTEMTQGSW
jgi:hypothetical protein